MPEINFTSYLNALFSIISGVLNLSDLDKLKKEELTGNIAGTYLQRYNAKLVKLSDKSSGYKTQIALEELENIVKEMIQIVNKTLNEDAKKKFNQQSKLMLEKILKG